MAAADLGLEDKRGEWPATDFENGSVRLDAAFEGVPGARGVQAHTAAPRAVTEFGPIAGVRCPGIRDETLEQYCRLGELVAPREKPGIGLHDGGNGAPKERKHVTRGDVAEIRSELSKGLAVCGSAQGIIHAWLEESDPPFFQLGEAATSALIKRLYPEALHAASVAALELRSTVIHAAGIGRYARGGAIAELRVDRPEAVRPLKDRELHDPFGVASDFTGAASTVERVESLRDGRAWARRPH